MTAIESDTVVTWARGVRSRYDETREQWMILGPERVVVPQGPGADIARLVDGERTVDAIVSQLVEEYDADRETIEDETLQFLRQLADQGYIAV